ncbi:MAG: hypothetical protein ACJA1R_002207 [Flavobacteriales bacterium]|jgi:hypothetical protein
MNEVRPQHHPDETMMLDASSGAADPRLIEIVGVHLALCADCQADMSLLEAAAGAAMLTFSPELAPLPPAIATAMDSWVGVHVDTRELLALESLPTHEAVGATMDSPGWRPFENGALLLPLVWPDRDRALLLCAVSPGEWVEGALRPRRPLVVLRGELVGPQNEIYRRGDFVPARGAMRTAGAEPAIYVLGVADNRKRSKKKA